MRWVLGFGALLVVLVLLVPGVGYVIPVSHVASVTARLDVSPDRVWSAITDVEGFPRWRSDVERVEWLQREDGLQAWVEIGTGGRLPMEVTQSSLGDRLEVRIIDEGLPFGGTWTYELASVPLGTELTLTERGEVYNPVFRFVSRFVIGHEGTLRGYLGDLTEGLGGEVHR